MSGAAVKKAKAPVIKEVLTGVLAHRFGALPKVALPADNERLKEMVEDTVDVVADKGLFRRGSSVVVPFAEDSELKEMVPDAFCSWVEVHVAFYKTRYDEKGGPIHVVRSMPSSLAKQILDSWHFWPRLPKVERCNAVPLPVLRANGKMELLPLEYDQEEQTFTFDGLNMKGDK